MADAGAGSKRSYPIRSNSQTEIMYETPGVFGEISDSKNELSNVDGCLSIVKRYDGVYLEWTSVEEQSEKSNNTVSSQNIQSGSSSDAKVIQTSPKKGAAWKRTSSFSFDLKELRSFKLSKDRRGDTYVRFHGKDGTSYTPLIFRHAASEDFVTALQRHLTIIRSSKEDDLVIVMDENSKKLQESVASLFTDRNADFMSRLWSDPYTTALTGLGKVSGLFQELRTAVLDTDDFNAVEHSERIASLRELQRREDEEDAQNLHLQHDSTGFELVTRWELPTRPDVPRDEPLMVDEWNSYMNDDGSFHNVRELKYRIFRGGISHDLRKVAWQFLLGYYNWSSTSSERELQKQERADDYQRMKNQWESISCDQETRFGAFRDQKALIEKDVARTDRTHVFFEGDDNKNLECLTSVLMTYMMYNFDVGYVQGMSDLLSPIMIVMGNEIDSFWTFVGFMNRVFKNFEMDQKAILNQLMQLRELVVVYNPKLANYLESHESDNMYFCFRWILVLFKREFSFADVMKLWEVLWTDLPCPNFHLLVCLAILDSQSVVIMENKFGLTEILKHINDLSTRMDLEETLKMAEGIFHQLSCIQNRLPENVCNILGFQKHHDYVQDLESPPSPSKSASQSPSKQRTYPGVVQRHK